MAFTIKAIRGLLELEDKWTGVLTKAAGDTTKFESTITGLASTAKKAGGALTAGLTLPLAGIAVASATAAIAMNKNMANIATLIPTATDRVLELKTAVQNMAVDTGKSTADLAGGMYQVISAFGDTADTVKITEINAKAAAAGLATTLDAINLTSAVTKGYGDVTAEAVQKVADLAFKTVELGQTTFPELAASIGGVVPIAQALNVTQEELFAGFATLTGVTGNASEVSTQFTAVLSAMLNPTEEMSKAITQLGFSGSEAMVQELGLVGSLNALTATTDGSVEAVGKLLGRKEALTAALALTGAQADVFVEKYDAMNKSAGAATTAFEVQTKGINAAGFSWQQMTVRIEVARQRLGDVLLPILIKVWDRGIQPLLGGIEKLIGWFSKLGPTVQVVTVAFAAIAAAIGPILVAVGFMMQGFIAVLPVLKVVGLTIAGITAPIAIAAAAIIGLTVVWVKWGDDIKAVVTNTFNTVKEWLVDKWEGSILQSVARALAAMAGFWVALGVKITEVGILIFQVVKIYLLDKLSPIIDAAGKVWEGLSGFVSAAYNTIAPIVEAIYTIVKQYLLDKLTEVLGGIQKFFDGVAKVFNRMRSFISGEAAGAVADLGSTVSSLGEAGTAVATTGDAAVVAADKLTASSGKTVEALALVSTETGKVSTEMGGKLITALQDAQKEVDNLSGAMRVRLTRALQSGIFSMKEMSAMSGISERALQLFATGVDKAATAAKELGKDALDVVQRFNKEQLAIGAAVNQWSPKLNQALFEWGKRIVVVDNYIIPLTRSVKEQKEHVDRLAGAFKLAADDAIAKLAAEQEEVARVTDIATETFRRQKEEFEDFRSAIAGFADQSLGELGGAIASIVDHWAQAANALDKYREATTKAGKAAALLQGVGAVAGATGQGSTGSRVLGGAAAGAQIGMIAGPWGAAAGAVIGGLVGWFRGANAASKKQEELLQNLKTGALDAFGSMDKLRIAAGLVGVQIDAAFKSRDPKWLADTLNMVESKTQVLVGAMEEYGFTWEDLPIKARNSQMIELAETLFAKTDALRVAGIDYTEILKRQADDYVNLAQTAQRTGTEIPAHLKPVLQQLSDMGLLVDKTSGLMIDMGELTFAETLTQGFKGVETAIYELRDALVKDLGGSLDDLGRRRVSIPVKYEVENPETLTPSAIRNGIADKDRVGREVHIEMNIDGRTAARTILPYLPDEVELSTG